jgi:hypothetical protein
MSVRAKFRCNGNKDGSVSLQAVTTGSEENKTFWKYTPAGSISLSITNPDAVNQFEAGKEYYVDFTPAD